MKSKELIYKLWQKILVGINQISSPKTKDYLNIITAALLIFIMNIAGANMLIATPVILSITNPKQTSKILKLITTWRGG